MNALLLLAQASVMRDAVTAFVVIFTDFCALMILLAALRERKYGDRVWANESRCLMLTDGEQVFSLGAAEILIGRHMSADIRLWDRRVSRFHALLVLQDGNWRIEDLQSADGTFVNGRRIRSPRVLHPNDVIRIGESSFTVVRGSERGLR